MKPHYPDKPYALVVYVSRHRLGIAAGVGAGRLKAFNLKLEAQKLLCQRQIEQNTQTSPKAMAAAQR
ncbi:MAG: hypothetical protein WA182_19535 [Candidatus Sulfotelmatobacter sp.]